MIKTKKQMFALIGAFILTIVLGTVTYAFFNYTRTGVANVIRTGQINFATTQSSGQDGEISLTDVFPIDVSEGVPSNNANVGEVTINVTGNTTYTGGIEYLVTATNVTNTVGNKVIPIGINVTATSGLGESDADYFTDKENNPETSIYKVLAGDTLESDTNLLVGYIKSGQTGVNGNIIVKAYLDASKVAISDTYYENAPTPTPTAPNDEYGTPASFGEGRVVLTTTEWNSLQTNGVSFKVKVEANEGLWFEDPTPALPTMAEMCPGCMYMWVNKLLEFDYGENGITLADLQEEIGDANYYYSSNYEDVITNDRKFFMGLVLDNGTSGKITRVFTCGIKTNNPNDGVPFCLEGSSNGSTDARNTEILSQLWNMEIQNSYAYNSCFYDHDGISCMESENSEDYAENGLIRLWAGYGYNDVIFVRSEGYYSGVNISSISNHAWFDPDGN